MGGVPEIKSPNLYMVNKVEEISKILGCGIEPKPDDSIRKQYSSEKAASEFEAMFQQLRRSKKTEVKRN